MASLLEAAETIRRSRDLASSHEQIWANGSKAIDRFVLTGISVELAVVPVRVSGGLEPPNAFKLPFRARRDNGMSSEAPYWQIV